MHAAHALAPALLAGLAWLSADLDLAPRRETGRALRVTTETLFELETVDSTFEMDGEVREGFDLGAHTLETRRIVHVDRCVEAADGRPTVVRRAFEEVALEGTLAFGSREQPYDREGPLQDAVLELRADGDQVRVERVDGSAPDDAVLGGQRIDLALAALLPGSAVEVGDAWELDAERIVRALEADLQQAYFPPIEDGERRGMRGMQASLPALVRDGAWEGEATLEVERGELGGRSCAVVALRIEGAGTRTEAERSEGGGRRSRATAPPAPALATTFAVELEGRLWISTELGVPLGLELEGPVAIDAERTRSRGESQMTMRSRREGNVSYRVTIEPAPDAE